MNLKKPTIITISLFVLGTMFSLINNLSTSASIKPIVSKSASNLTPLFPHNYLLSNELSSILEYKEGKWNISEDMFKIKIGDVIKNRIKKIHSKAADKAMLLYQLNPYSIDLMVRWGDNLYSSGLKNNDRFKIKMY